MKKRAFLHWVIGVALIMVPAAVAWLPTQHSPDPGLVTAADSAADLDLLDADLPDDSAGLDPQPGDLAAEGDIADAPAKVISSDLPLPGEVNPAPAVRDMLKLAQSGMEESVLLAYASNSAAPFELTSEQIIYLTDLGIPPTVVTAMLQRDHLLKATQAAPISLVDFAPTNMARMPSLIPGAAPMPALEPVVARQTVPEDSELVPPPPATPVTDTTFHEALSPYGTWLDVQGYGECWQPSVVQLDPGWQPYFDRGRWVYSDCGWYWASDYSWGWAPFHYGRWFRHNRLGWCWVPGTVWGPSWVCWRSFGDYCGWAPLPPSCGFAFGIGLTFHGQPAGADCDFGLAPAWFPFVRTHDLFSHRLTAYAVPPSQTATFFAHTTVSSRIVGHNGQPVNHGLAVPHVVAATHHEPPPLPAQELRARERDRGWTPLRQASLGAQRPYEIASTRLGSQTEPALEAHPTRALRDPLPSAASIGQPGMTEHTARIESGATPNRLPSSPTTPVVMIGQNRNPQRPIRTSGAENNQGNQGGLTHNRQVRPEPEAPTPSTRVETAAPDHASPPTDWSSPNYRHAVRSELSGSPVRQPAEISSEPPAPAAWSAPRQVRPEQPTAAFEANRPSHPAREDWGAPAAIAPPSAQHTEPAPVHVAPVPAAQPATHPSSPASSRSDRR